MSKQYLIQTPHIGMSSVTTEYAHTDNEELYLKNKKRFGKSWYYYDNPIKYNINSMGYRMPEFDKINWDNYILFLGCSFTVGIGLHLENTFPYIVSKKLNCDYVNGAIGGSSPDFAVNNLIHFLNRAEKLPKSVVITWPDTSRTMYWGPGGFPVFKLPNLNNAGTFVNSYKEFLLSSSNMFTKFKYNVETVKLICSSANIKLVETALNKSLHTEYHNSIKIWNLPDNITDVSKIHSVKARDIRIEDDVSHLGIIPHSQISKYIIDELEEIYENK
jgi:hypothetical protein